MLLARRWARCNGSAEFISALNPRTNDSNSAFNAPRFAEFRAFRQKRAANASLSRILLPAFALWLVHTNIQDMRPPIERQASNRPYAQLRGKRAFEPRRPRGGLNSPDGEVLGVSLAGGRAPEGDALPGG